MDDHTEAHKSTRPSAMKCSDEEVQQVMSTFEHFINPFQTSEDQQTQLFCLSSGQPALPKVAKDLSRYVKAGEKAAKKFTVRHDLVIGGEVWDEDEEVEHVSSDGCKVHIDVS